MARTPPSGWRWVLFDADVPELVRGDLHAAASGADESAGQCAKFTERGRIDLRLSKISGDTQACRLRFWRCRTPAWASRLMCGDRLFTPFAQADA